MRVNFLPVESAVSFWLRGSGIEGHFDRDLMRARASDGIRLMIGDEQTSLRLALIDIDNFEGVMPSGIHSVALVVCSKEDRLKIAHGKMVQWLYDHPSNKDCEIEVNLICPECHKENCGDHDIVEIEADKLFQRNSPDMFVNHWKSYAGFGKPVTDEDGHSTTIGGHHSSFPGFEVMSPLTAEDTIWNVEHQLGECVAGYTPKLVGGKKYRLEEGKIITDFKKGQVIVSYLGYSMDGAYYRMPDFPQAFMAIEHYLDASHFKRRWLKKLESTVRQAYLQSLAQWTEAFPRVRSALSIPDHNSWVHEVKKELWVWNDEYQYTKNSY